VDAEPTLTIGGRTLDHNEEIEAFLSEPLFTAMRRRLRGGGKPSSSGVGRSSARVLGPIPFRGRSID